MDLPSLTEELERFGQQHLLKFWDTLTDDQKQQLYKDLRSINFAEVTRIFQQSTQPAGDGEIDDALLEPLPDEVHESVTTSSEDLLRDYREEGKCVSVAYGACVLVVCKWCVIRGNAAVIAA